MSQSHVGRAAEEVPGQGTEPKAVNRREFLRQVGRLALPVLAAVGFGSLLSGCGGGEEGGNSIVCGGYCVNDCGAQCAVGCGGSCGAGCGYLAHG
jgi:hypothetical protein